MSSSSSPSPSPVLSNPLFQAVLFCTLVVGAYHLASDHYLIFHSFAELFSVVIAAGIFMIAWNSRSFYDNNYLLFIGIAYLFVALFDTLHTLAYPGMGVFRGFDENDLPPQLWLVARYLESLALLAAPLFFRFRLPVGRVVAFFSLLSALAIWAIFLADIFPTCFVTGQGLTLFKRISEYSIDLVLVGALFLLYRDRRHFEPAVLRLLSLSIVCTIVTELFFTVYIHHYGLSNFIGHLFKILAFYFMYKAIIETALRQPYSLLFRELKQSEEQLRAKEESLLFAQRLAHMGSWEWHLDDDSVWWSDETYSILGYDREQTVPTLERFMERVHPDDLTIVRAAVATYRAEGKPFTMRHRIVTADGVVRHVRVETTTNHTGQEEREWTAIGIIHDISEQVATEKLREDIERITRHDLKTPLNPVLSIPDILISDGNLTPEQVELLQMIKASGFRMLSIINSSLSLYRMERGTYTYSPEPFDVLPVLEQIARENADLVEMRKLELKTVVGGNVAGEGSSFIINGEELLCYTMLANLVKNALEASPAGGTVTVSFSEDSSWYTIEVHNQGAVPAEIRTRFFDQFVTHGKKFGTGLGTYSAKLAARTQQGDVAMETSEEWGTRIRVRLPREPISGLPSHELVQGKSVEEGGV